MIRLARGMVLLAIGACSSAAWAEDLVNVYRLAEAQDPQFRGVQAAENAVREARPQARAQLLPSVNISAAVSGNFQSFTTPSGNTQFGPSNFRSDFLGYEYTLSVTQPIYHRDRFIQLKQADSRIQQAEVEVGAARQDLMVRVAERYFDVLAAIDNREFAHAEKTALQRQLDQANQRFEVGLIAITDVQEAQAGRDRAVAEEILAEKLLEDTRDALREITGEYHKELAKLGAKLALIQPDPMDIEQWTRLALAQNLRLSSAELAARTAREEIRRQAAGHLPALDLVGSHGFSSTGGRFGDVDSEIDIIGLQLNLPIYQGGLVSSRTREAEHRHIQALEELEQQKRAAHRQTREAYLGVIAGISRINALTQAVTSNETAVEATEAGFEVGTRTAVDIVIAERELFRAKRDYARARYDYILDSLRLKRAVGTLSVEDLDKVTAWLEH